MAIRIGIIGAGGIGRIHAQAAAAAGAVVAGVFDVNRDRAASLAAAHTGAVAAPSLDKLLSLRDLAAVVVAVPNHLHKPYAIQALEAGLDVLLEKPMGMDVAECDEIIAAIEHTGRLVQVGFVSRCAPAARAVKHLIDAGRFGRIYHARGQWYRRRGIPGLGGWFTTKALSGGGVLIDLGVHLVDLILDMTGRPRAERLSGTCTSIFGAPIERYAYTEMWGGPPEPNGTFDVEDGAAALIRFEGGMTAEISVTWAANLPESDSPCGVTLLGDRGGCTFNVWGSSVVVATEERRTLIDLSPRFPSGDAFGDAFRRQHAAFLEAVGARAEPAASAAHGRDVQAILDAIYRSSEERREVEVG